MSRMPFPREVVCLMAQHAFYKQKVEFGLMMHLAIEAYLRPGELGKLRVGDLIPPVSGSRGGLWALVLRPMEEGQMSKAQEFDEPVLFDLPEQAVVAETVYRVLRLAFRKKTELNRYFKATQKS